MIARASHESGRLVILKIGTLINHNALLRAVLALTPIVVIAAAFGQEIWLQAALVTVSVDVAADRSGLAPVGIVFHGVAIATGFIALVVSFAVPALFVGCITLLAAASILVTVRGTELRTLGMFTFIPALYLACETADKAPPDQLIERGFAMLPYIILAIVPVLLFSALKHVRTRHPEVPHIQHFRRVLIRADHRKPASFASEMIAIALSVAVAASLVRGFDIAHGQWVIWSAACIVTGDAASARVKLQDRVIGALVGVPAGVAVGLMLPHYRFVYEIDLVIALLTFVAFHRYRTGFGVRCGCAAIAFILLGQSTITAGERAANVILGGMIGILFVLLVPIIATCIKPFTR